MAKPKHSHLSLVHLTIFFIITIIASTVPSLASSPRFLGKFSRSSRRNSQSPKQRLQYETRYFAQTSTTLASPTPRSSNSGTSSTPSTGWALSAKARSFSTAATRATSNGSP
ncbi:hypothetical protein M0R45_001463 [Rubus argutus]|uniref:Uncharacterized protein n=1 Tax=Rubus argutus TaxID=59490 RepID=A0AAW1VKS3_RUBAR